MVSLKLSSLNIVLRSSNQAKKRKAKINFLETPLTLFIPLGEGFEVGKFGCARISMIGFPSVGKSTLLSTVTETKSLAAAYEFTTLTCIPGTLILICLQLMAMNLGVINYKDTKIQLLDLPGIIEGAAHGKGRGRQVILKRFHLPLQCV